MDLTTNYHPPPHVTESAQSSEIQIKATSTAQNPHKYALKFLYNSNEDWMQVDVWAFPVSLSPSNKRLWCNKKI